MTKASAVATPLAILFDIDGCLISTGGAGTRAWRHAFDRLHGIPADIGQFTEAGMTDPEVGRLTFARVLNREPTDREMARLLGAYLEQLVTEVEQSPSYRVMPGVTALLPRLIDAGIMLGLVSGALEAAAHIKLARAGLNRFFSFGGYGSDSIDRGELTRTAAHAVKAVAVGVATGKYTRDDLRAAGGDYVLATLEEPLPGVPDALRQDPSNK